jgi:hypothetical protein
MSEMISAHSILSTSSSRELDSEENIHLSFVKFPFQDELLSAPVYQRTMLKMLRGNSFESPKSNRNTDTNPVPRTQVSEPVLGNADYDGILVGATRVLRDIGDFSTSCRYDLEALRDTSKPSTAHLPRHLPISNVICRQELSSEEKFEIDQKFLQAVKEGNAGEVANLLDSGADINAYESGSSPGSQKVALSLCLENIDTTPSRQDSYFEIANLLLLYNEILSGKFVNPSCTILHACMKHGIAAIIKRLPKRAQIFGIRDSLGNSPLHLAVQAGERGLDCIKALCKISTEKSLRLGEISDFKGRSALQLALENRLYRQALLLIRLGGAGKVKNTTDNSELPSTIYIAFDRRRCQPDKGMSVEDLLRLAIERNQLKAVRELLAQGAVCTDDMLECVRNTDLLLQLLQHYSAPTCRSIDVSHLIYGKIWGCSRYDIDAALRGDRHDRLHNCQERVRRYFVLSRLPDPLNLRPQTREHCIHTALAAVLLVRDHYPDYPASKLDAKLRLQLGKGSGGDSDLGFDVSWRSLTYHPLYPYL